MYAADDCQAYVNASYIDARRKKSVMIKSRLILNSYFCCNDCMSDIWKKKLKISYELSV